MSVVDRDVTAGQIWAGPSGTRYRVTDVDLFEVRFVILDDRAERPGHLPIVQFVTFELVTAAPAPARLYVDQFPGDGWGKWNGGGHLLSSDLDALHAIAAKLGLRRAWFQSGSRFAHYDLTAGKRRRALTLGVIPIASGELPDDVLMRCPDGRYQPRHQIMARRAAVTG